MANAKAKPTATEMDYAAHERNYAGFLSLFRWGTVIVAIIAFIVILIIS